MDSGRRNWRPGFFFIPGLVLLVDVGPNGGRDLHFTGSYF